MGSVVSHDSTCEQCGWTGCLRSHNTNTYRTWIMCGRCGHQVEWCPKIDRKHLHETGRRRFLLSREGQAIFYPFRKRSHGVFYLASIAGASSMGSIAKPIDDSVVAWFHEELLRDGVDGENSFLARWNPDVKQIESVVGIWMDPFEGQHDEETDVTDAAERYDLDW